MGIGVGSTAEVFVDPAFYLTAFTFGFNKLKDMQFCLGLFVCCGFFFFLSFLNCAIRVNLFPLENYVMLAKLSNRNLLDVISPGIVRFMLPLLK